MISSGCIVRINRQGDILWVVHSRTTDGRWKCVRSVNSWRGERFTSLSVGEGDVVLVAAAPVYEVGVAIMHNGIAHVVLADHGDAVELEVPSSRFPLKGGGALSILSGNVITLSKSDLALEAFK